jgi:hypothetical protein
MTLITPGDSAANLIPNATPVVAAQFNQVLLTLRQVCAEFHGNERNDSAWIFVPGFRLNAASQRNLITVWPNGASLKLDIRPRPPGELRPVTFAEEEIGAYQARLQLRHDQLLAL